MLEAGRTPWEGQLLERARSRGVLRATQYARIRSFLDHGLGVAQVLVGAGILSPEAYLQLLREVLPDAEMPLPTTPTPSLQSYESGRHALMTILDDPLAQTGHIHERSHGSFWPALRARWQQALPQGRSQGWLPHRLGGSRRIAQERSTHPIVATHAWKRITKGEPHLLIERPDEELLGLLLPYVRGENMESLRSPSRNTDDSDRRMVCVRMEDERGMLSSLLLLGNRVCVQTMSSAETEAMEGIFLSLKQPVIVLKQTQTPQGSAWHAYSL